MDIDHFSSSLNKYGYRDKGEIGHQNFDLEHNFDDTFHVERGNAHLNSVAAPVVVGKTEIHDYPSQRQRQTVLMELMAAKNMHDMNEARIQHIGYDTTSAPADYKLAFGALAVLLVVVFVFKKNP